MFKAKLIMTRDVCTVHEDTPVYEAMRVLVDKGVTGLPVVDDDMCLLGIVSEKDMLRLLWETREKHGTVGHVMTRETVTFDESTEVSEVCECLIANSFRRVPILADGKLVGIVSRSDIIKFILDLREKKL